MPETLLGFYRQRLRWAQGGAETVLKYFRQMLRMQNLRLWPLYLEYLITLFWAFALLIMIPFGLWQSINDGSFNPLTVEVPTIITFCLFLLQFSVSMIIDSRYETGLYRYFFHCIWYPYAFWLLNGLTLLHGFPRAVFRDKNRAATWISPDRGLQ